METMEGKSRKTATCELDSLELPLQVFSHQDHLLLSPVLLQPVLQPPRELHFLTGLL